MSLRLSLSGILWKLPFLIILINSCSFVHATPGAVRLSPDARWARYGTTVAGIENGTAGSSLNSLNYSSTIRISNGDILYVADWNNYRVVIVNLKSPEEKTILGTGYGNGPSQFRTPGDVYVTESKVYVLDTWNYRIQRWSIDGTNPTVLPGANTFSTSYYFFIDKNDYIYVSVYDGSKIIRFAPDSSDSTMVAGTGTAGNTPSQLYRPYGIFVDEDLTMYIADAFNHRVQKWSSGASYGITVAGNGTRGSNSFQLWYPSAVLVDTNGYMYIAETGFNNRVVRWAPNSVVGVCIAACTLTKGNRASQFSFPSGLDFDSNGSLYVSDATNNRVQKFQILSNDSSSPIGITTAAANNMMNATTANSVTNIASAEVTATTTTMMFYVFEFLIVIVSMCHLD